MKLFSGLQDDGGVRISNELFDELSSGDSEGWAACGEVVKEFGEDHFTRDNANGAERRRRVPCFLMEVIFGIEKGYPEARICESGFQLILSRSAIEVVVDVRCKVGRHLGPFGFGDGGPDLKGELPRRRSGLIGGGFRAVRSLTRLGFTDKRANVIAGVAIPRPQGFAFDERSNVVRER